MHLANLRPYKMLIAFLSFLCLATLTVPVLYSQVQNGTITGAITDSTGAVIPDANLTLTNKATGLVLHTHSGKQGIYIFPQLIPGDYTLQRPSQ